MEMLWVILSVRLSDLANFRPQVAGHLAHSKKYRVSRFIVFDVAVEAAGYSTALRDRGWGFEKLGKPIVQSHPFAKRAAEPNLV